MGGDADYVIWGGSARGGFNPSATSDAQQQVDDSAARVGGVVELTLAGFKTEGPIIDGDLDGDRMVSVAPLVVYTGDQYDKKVFGGAELRGGYQAPSWDRAWVQPRITLTVGQGFWDSQDKDTSYRITSGLVLPLLQGDRTINNQVGLGLDYTLCDGNSGAQLSLGLNLDFDTFVATVIE